MSAVQALREFEQSLRELLSNTHDYPEIVKKAQPLLKKLLATPDLLPAEYRQTPSNKYGQYLLYKPEDEAFSIIAFVWGPGQISPVHDHLVWGLVGMYEGAIAEKRFRRIDDRSNPTRAVLQEVETVHARAGDVSFVYPEEADIHQVFNPHEGAAISIHVYGTDIGKQKRHVYDLQTGAIHDVVTKHDNEQPVYAALSHN